MRMHMHAGMRSGYGERHGYSVRGGVSVGEETDVTYRRRHHFRVSEEEPATRVILHRHHPHWYYVHGRYYGHPRHHGTYYVVHRYRHRHYVEDEPSVSIRHRYVQRYDVGGPEVRYHHRTSVTGVGVGVNVEERHGHGARMNAGGSFSAGGREHRENQAGGAQHGQASGGAGAAQASKAGAAPAGGGHAQNGTTAPKLQQQ